MSTPGIADPHWYEWFVGLKYVIEMLNSDSGIDYVIFQSNDYDTVDDVVVQYSDGSTQLCFQVKHQIATSNPNNLTFGKMLENNGEKNCLFKALFLGWKAASTNAAVTTKAILYTNRVALNRRTRRAFNGEKYSAYPLDKFVELINQKLINCQDSIHFMDEENNLSFQWQEFNEALGQTDIHEVSLFLSNFNVEANQLGLTDMKQSLVVALSQAFSCNEGIAHALFARLLVGLSEWTTSIRKSERVTLETVFSVLGIEEDLNDSQHRLAPPYPFFESRQNFCVDLEIQIKQTDKKVVFISGDPGSGKTSIISYLQATTNLFMFRYHTFRPISPEQHFYNQDPGMYTIENLWGTLLIQLRKKLKGKLAQYSVPVSNKLINSSDLRSHVMRLLGILGKEGIENNQKVFLCIDGIDHAARSNNQVSFLSSLPIPYEIPDGVCLVVVGQPTPMYNEQYPLWLSTSNDVEPIYIPKLNVGDIKQLILSQASQFEKEADGLANFIYEKTEGNNLSTVFAFEQIKTLNQLEDAMHSIDANGINSDIQQYYSHIWLHMKTELAKIAPTMIFPESIVACPLLLMSGRVNVRILARSLPYKLGENDWTMVFNRLYPLVVPTDNTEEYSLFHNDFRIFLMDVISSYNDRYKEIAINLAKYLLQNKEGLLSYISPIPLLMCADKANFIPNYFTATFVIDALAEGISKQRLDEYAHISYDIACTNKDLEGYINTYLAIKTLYQHERYFEYYDRSYISNDYPEISSIDINEIRALSLSKDTLDEFQNVLDLCIKLYTTEYKDCSGRALALYDMWFAKLTPLSLISICDKLITEENTWELNSTPVGFFLQHWGSSAAQLNITLQEIKRDTSELEKRAITIFGDQYFKYCIEHGLYEMAISALYSGYVTNLCFCENLASIYYANVANSFEHFLTKVTPNKKKPTWNLLALAMKTTCCNVFFIKPNFFETLQPIKHTYDEAIFAIILRAFLLGHSKNDLDDNEIIQDAETCYDQLKNNDNDKTVEQISFLARFSCLLGKYYSVNTPNSTLFNEYTQWFLNAKLYRSHDYSSSRKFLLFTLLNSNASSTIYENEWFISSLQTSLFEIENLGMYYKTHILDYLKKCNRFDIIKEYINELYGEKCGRMNLVEDKIDSHRHFISYGQLVEPELMQFCSLQLKWDIVGYIGYKEYAMYGPYDCFKTIIEEEPSAWKTLGVRLYQQSQIAEVSSNRAAFDIHNSIVKAASINGLNDYWQLHSSNDEFRMNPNSIYHSIFGFIQCSKNGSDLESIWLLSCGIHSWYTQDGHSGAKAIFNACCKKGEEIAFDFYSFVNKLTPNWLSIIQQCATTSSYHSSNDAYTVERQKEVAQINEEFNNTPLPELLSQLPYIATLNHANVRFNLILTRALSEEACQHENLQQLLVHFCSYIEGQEWSNTSYEPIISKLLTTLSCDAFWSLALTIKPQLSEYNYQTSTRNMQLLLKTAFETNIDKLKILFDKELGIQELWITGNGHILIEQDQHHTKNKFGVPESRSEMVLYILLQQLETQNARKIESAIHGIFLLGQHFSDVMDSISFIWDKLSLIERECLLNAIARWANDKICSPKLCDKLYSEYTSCNELSYIYILHSILSAQGCEVIQKDKITYNAHATSHRLPESGISNNTSYCENFLRLVESDSSNSQIVDNIRRYIFSAECSPQYKEDSHCKVGDSKIPVHSQLLDTVLYAIDQNCHWDATSILLKKSSLIPVEDPYLLTEMPYMTFDKKWFPQIHESYESKKEENLTEGVLSQIVNYNIPLGYMCLASCLWHPWGHNDGSIYVESSKVDLPFGGYQDCDFEQSLGNFGLLSKDGTLVETCNATIGSGGASLFNRMAGNCRLSFGNCQLAPSSIWRDIFKCKPSKQTPYIWVDEAGSEVLHFERIASPYREARHELYIRQPVLFRWVCNEEWLKATLAEYGLAMWWFHTIESYPD